jgi:hypothetical protein
MALTYIGATEFVRSGPPQWGGGQFDLDTLSVEYSGAAPGLDAFLDSLHEGQESEIDSNMLLVNWRPSSASKFYPSVTLNYLGAKGGIMPPGQNRLGNSLQTATTESGASNVTLTYLAPWTEYTWISREPFQGAIALPPSGPAASNVYKLTGSVGFTAGGTTLTGFGTIFTTEVEPEDRIFIPLIDPVEAGLAPIPPGTPWAFSVTVVSVISDTILTFEEAAPIYGQSYAADVAVGFHKSSVDVTVISIRYGCGFAGDLAGQEVWDWGPYLAGSFYQVLNTPSFESEEIIPGRYWRNVQRNTTSLIANPC